MTMRRTIVLLAVLLMPFGAVHAREVHLLKSNVDLGDKASLQRGARLFVNYCLTCHSAKYMRFNRMGVDLGISDELLKQNMMFASDKVGGTMTVAMRAAQGEKWFGKAPPDLSVVARSRGPDWIYTFLLSFYKDEDPSRLFGVNNLMLPGAAMPAVLSELQGDQVLVEVEGGGEGEHGAAGGARLELEREGVLNPAKYRRAARDLVNFLVYTGEPAKMVRYQLGIWVLLFLVILFFISRALYKEYWKDVH